MNNEQYNAEVHKVFETFNVTQNERRYVIEKWDATRIEHALTHDINQELQKKRAELLDARQKLYDQRQRNQTLVENNDALVRMNEQLIEANQRKYKNTNQMPTVELHGVNRMNIDTTTNREQKERDKRLKEVETIIQNLIGSINEQGYDREKELNAITNNANKRLNHVEGAFLELASTFAKAGEEAERDRDGLRLDVVRLETAVFEQQAQIKQMARTLKGARDYGNQTRQRLNSIAKAVFPRLDALEESE